MNALRTMRYTSFGSYKTAWTMCHKIRAARIENIDELGGIVEVDEAFIGGKDKNRHWDKKEHVTGTSKRMAVIGAVKRKGNVVTRVVDKVNRGTIEALINETVSTRVSLLCTADCSGYNRMHYRFNHGVVDHPKGHHVIGAIHASAIEGFRSIVKRGVVSTFHKVRKKYLPLYVTEFQFRYDNRENADIFGSAISWC